MGAHRVGAVAAKIDVVVPGRPTLDVVLTGLDEWPRAGREIYARELALGGGAHMNTAAALARLELGVAFVAVVGDDAAGEWVLRAVHREALPVEHVEVLADVPTPVSVALNLAGDRGFVTFGPEHERGERRYVQRTLELLAERPVRHVHGDLSATGYLLDAARSAGATVSVDAHDGGAWLASDDVRRVTSSVDVLFVNESEATGITGARDPDAAARRLADDCSHVVLKRCAEGAAAHVDGRVVHAEAVPADVVDATGAGDCFVAGYLWGYLGGRPTETCLALGNICGARGVGRLGGYAGAPTLAELTSAARGAGIALT
jgi:sugar/nucleoside kinase (ribokinase family)